MTNPHFKFASLFLGLALVFHASGEEPPVQIDVKGAGNSLISSNVIPIPVEIFSALDKLGSRDWNSQIDRRPFKPSPDRSRCALLFGLAISQGFIAVQAENAEEVKRIGVAVQRLASPLGVSTPVESRIKIILDHLKGRDWESIKQEFDRTRQTVLKTMESMRDDDLASLVSLGGWLGGTEALAAMLKTDYSPEGSDLLNQDELLKQLREEFEALPASIKTDKIFSKIEAAFVRLENLMKVDASGKVSLAKVTRIHKETQSIVNEIYRN